MKSKVLATVLTTVSIFQGTLALGASAEGECSSWYCKLFSGQAKQEAERKDDITSQSKQEEIVKKPEEQKVEIVKNPEEQKQEILKNYPPNLGEIQEIGLGFMVDGPNGKKIEQTVRPDAHFIESGKEYLQFYPEHIPQLQEAIRGKLDQETKDWTWYSHLFSSKNKLLTKAEQTALVPQEGSYMDCKPFGTDVRKDADGNTVIEYVTRDTDGSPIFQESTLVYDKERDVLIVGIKKRALTKEECKTVYNLPENSKSSLSTVDKAELFATNAAHLNYALQNCGEDLEKCDSVCSVVIDKDFSKVLVLNKHYDFAKIEKTLYGIMNSGLSKKDMILELDKAVDFYREDIKPWASNMQTVEFCYPLNRASSYLAKLEKDREHRDLETLTAMYNLRQKINALITEHRFVFKENMAPILGVKTDRCKVIVDTERETTIYLEREDTKKFINKVEDELISKHGILSEDLEMEGFTNKNFRKDFIKLAKELKPESDQDMLDSMAEDVAKAEAEKVTLEREAQSMAARSLLGTGIRMGIAYFTGGTSEIAATGIKIVKDAVEGDGEKFSKEEIEECLNEEKSKKLPLNENKNEQQSETAVCQRIDEMKLSSKQRSDIMKALDKYVESIVMDTRIQIKKNRQQFLAKLKTRKEIYLNLLNLYIKMNYRDYANRNDYDGVIIEERRTSENKNSNDRLLREYFVNEIQRWDGILQ
ncbi:MAG: hypothetical protein RUMPE_00915 [Eubacteriales bacterium SKADARSKE-1]|nr:hypothetical protein [Eubacteriales bacterium SKADARSKE-1]